VTSRSLRRRAYRRVLVRAARPRLPGRAVMVELVVPSQEHIRQSFLIMSGDTLAVNLGGWITGDGPPRSIEVPVGIRVSIA